MDPQQNPFDQVDPPGPESSASTPTRTQTRRARFDIVPFTDLQDSGSTRSNSPEPLLSTPTLQESYAGLKKNLSFRSLRELELKELHSVVWRKGGRGEPGEKRHRPRNSEEVFAHAVRGGISELRKTLGSAPDCQRRTDVASPHFQGRCCSPAGYAPESTWLWWHSGRQRAGTPTSPPCSSPLKTHPVHPVECLQHSSFARFSGSTRCGSLLCSEHSPSFSTSRKPARRVNLADPVYSKQTLHSLRLFNPGKKGRGQEEYWHSAVAGAVSGLAVCAEKPSRRVTLGQQMLVRCVPPSFQAAVTTIS
jgi:hypothetical protein